MKLIDFLASAPGRLVRAIAGLALIGGGAYLMATNNVVIGLIVGLVGLVPLLAGMLDVCVFAPLFGAPFQGMKIRQRVHAM